MKIDIRNLNIWKESPVENLAETEKKIMYLPMDCLDRMSDVPEAVSAAQALFKSQSEGNGPRAKCVKKPVVWYYVFLTKKFTDKMITELDLEQRSLNSLRRAGIMTVGDLLRSIDGPEDLRRNRGCGNSCIGDVTARLFACQFENLGTKDRLRFLSASRRIGQPEEDRGLGREAEGKEPSLSVTEEPESRIMSFRTQALLQLKETADPKGLAFIAELEKLSPYIEAESGLWPHIRFPVYACTLSDDTGIEELGLYQRAFNSLKRAGLHNIRSLCAGIEGNEEALDIRNCGTTSTGEIIGKIAMHQYLRMDEAGREKYLERIRQLNS